MSRIGRMPIAIPNGVKVNIADSNQVTVTGPKGSLTRRLPSEMQIEMDNGALTVSRPGDEIRHKALHGLTRALLANMVTGVAQGFRRELDVQGVGYRAELQGGNLVLSVGFAHTVTVPPPEGIAFDVDRAGRFIGIVGVDKELVGETAARIRRIRPPEPYKGKGIRYTGEFVRIKPGKSGKA